MKKSLWLLYGYAFAYNLYMTFLNGTRFSLWFIYFPPTTVTGLWWYVMGSAPMVTLIALLFAARHAKSMIIVLLYSYATAYNAFVTWLYSLTPSGIREWLEVFPPLSLRRLWWCAMHLGPTITLIVLAILIRQLIVSTAVLPPAPMQPTSRVR